MNTYLIFVFLSLVITVFTTRCRVVPRRTAAPTPPSIGFGITGSLLAKQAFHILEINLGFIWPLFILLHNQGPNVLLAPNLTNGQFVPVERPHFLLWFGSF